MLKLDMKLLCNRPESLLLKLRQQKKEALVEQAGKPVQKLGIDTAVVEWFKSQGRGKMEKRIQCFMSNLELLAQLRHFSRADKFQMMLFLIAELAKEEGIVMGNESAEIMYSVHTSNSAAAQLMQLLETEQKQTQNV
ncbi:MAG: hypothetical protein U7126_16025 [Microcoleus sp.]